MPRFLTISVLLTILATSLCAKTYTYLYTGNTFDTQCQYDFPACIPISSGNLSAYAMFTQPLGPNQTVDEMSPFLTDWSLDGGIPGFGSGARRLSLATDAMGRIVSWNLFFSQRDFSPNFSVEAIFTTESDSVRGDSTLSGVEIDQFYYTSYSVATPGTWVADFVTPEPAATPLLKLFGLLAASGMVWIRRRPGA